MHTSCAWGLLDHYATATPQRFFQIDGFHGVVADSVFSPDENGDCIFGFYTTELRHCGPELAVRVHIHETADPEVAVRQLRNMADLIEEGFFWTLTEPFMRDTRRATR